MCLLLWTLLWLQALAPIAAPAAEPSSQADKPYRLLVVLHFADDAMFTPAFTGAVEREVRDQTRNLFGPLAAVEVANKHPLVDRLPPGGLAALELPPEEFAASLKLGEQSFDKAFLFQIDYRAGLYELAWRQLDGDVAQLGPYRSRNTPDRPWLGKAIGLAIQDDFAPTAAVLPTVERDKVQLEFRGLLLDGPRLANWLGEDCVLQPFWVVQQGDGSLARVPLPFTALELTPDGGGKWARVITNLPNPWLQTARVVGFQAWKLHTQSGRFRLHLVDQSTGEPLQNCSVYAGERGFDSLGDGQRLPDPDARGYVVASRPFERLAYLRISQDAGPGVQLPLPITADWCEMTCKVSIDEAAAEKSELERRIGYLVEDVKALETGLDDRVRDVNRLNGAKRYEEALRSTRDALAYGKKYADPSLKHLRTLDASWQKLKLPPGASLAWLEKQSQELASQQKSLETLAENLERIIQRNDAQSRANVLIELGNQAEREGDIDEALEKYSLALGEQPDQPPLAKRLDQLKAAWKIKSPEQRQARQFVYAVWAKIEPAGVETALPQATKAFETLRTAGDYLTAGKLMKVNERLVTELDQVIGQLAGRDGDADRQEHEKYVGLLEQLAKFQQQVADYYGAASLAGGLGAGSGESVKTPSFDAGDEKSSETTPPKSPAPADDAPPSSSAPSSKSSSSDTSDEEEEPPLSKTPSAGAK
ncbi:MAG TPA: hypothetical protein VMV10_00460 [Pirellulales bacterium]|nr:hypothetical protein [Pirellulales bacterium]